MSRLPFFLLIIGLCCFLERVNAGVRPINKRRLQERLCAIDSHYCEGLFAHDEPQDSDDNTEGIKNKLIEDNTDAVIKEEHKEGDDDTDVNDNANDNDEEDEDEEDLNLSGGSQEIDEPTGQRRNSRRPRRNRGLNIRRRGYTRNRRGRRNRRGKRGGKVRRYRRGPNRRNRKTKG